MPNLPSHVDVVVVGAGNAALCGALTAAEEGSSVVVLERAPRNERGGNGVFTGGFLRFAFDGIGDLRSIVDLTPDEEGRLEVGRYSPEDFFLEVAETTGYRADPDLVSVLVNGSLESVQWLRGQGVPFLPTFGLHPPDADGKVRMHGAAPAVEVSGGGAGLVQTLFERAEALGICILYGARAEALLTDGNRRVTGVAFRHDGAERTIRAGAVVLASGGFEASTEMRARYLGPSWDLVRVRGTKHNTGDGIKMAQAVGAQTAGHWTGCHAAPLDLNAPVFGDRKMTDTFVRRSFTLGITVNRDGVRFFDEGADLDGRTYSHAGKQIVQQPGQVAYQIFDANTAGLLRPEYTLRQTTRSQADSIAELAVKAGINPAGLSRTVEEFNAATSGASIDPLMKDGVSTVALSPNKSNWAAPISTPPFLAFPVTCGITFTYGGVSVTTQAQVVDEDGRPIQGLFAAGEMIGGVFFDNNPNGCAIMVGTVFGRVAGRSAAISAAMKAPA